jgi:hypothetical protein
MVSYILICVIPVTLYCVIYELVLSLFYFLKQIGLLVIFITNKPSKFYYLPLYLVIGYPLALLIVIVDIINIIKTLTDFTNYLEIRTEKKKVNLV